MNRFKIFTFAFLGATSIAFAQDLDASKKAIDAEQFEKAKTLLKTFIQSKPTNGEAPFLLGNIYLNQSFNDSAKIYFQKGLTAKEFANLNYIGLGQMDLDNGNAAAALSNFGLAMKDVRKKDTQEYVYIAQAYMKCSKPDYKAAINVLNRAKTANPTDAQVNLAFGNAFYGDKNQNEAYTSYRSAYQADNTLLRAKMQLGVLLKGAGSFDIAEKEYNNVIATDPKYGPVYRELAETFFLWANREPAKYNDYIQKALGFYEKYMTLTDYSLNSRMRHADFLVLARDYKALEIEANQMKQLDKVNPRIMRYLGYAAYQNGNNELAIKSLEEFINNPTTKKIARDYSFLGLAKIKKATAADGKISDPTAFDEAVVNLKKSVEMEPKLSEDLNALGSSLFKQKCYTEAACIFELATANKDQKNYLMDNFYLGYSLYYGYDKTKPDAIALQKAEIAFSNVIAISPTAQDAHLFKARIYNNMEHDEAMTKSYQDYINVVTTKGTDEMTKNKAKFVEAYNNMGAFFVNTDKIKAKEMWTKTVELDPANQYANESLKNLK